MNEKLSLKHAIGQLLIIGFEGTRLPIPLIGALTKGEVGGVILFSRNFESREQIQELTAQIHQIQSPYPIWIAIDQEGGKVQRIRENLGSPNLPSAMDIARTTPENARDIALQNARDLKSLGFDINFAPVLDIHTNPQNPIIATRAFGTTPEQVIEFAIPTMQGLIDGGIIPCGKHFPGHGDTLLDSHTDLPEVNHDMNRLQNVEFKPFKAAIEADIPMIMTAHIVMNGLGERFPSTLSPMIVTDILRKQLGFKGVIVSDDLEMDAIIDRFSTLKAVLLGIHAGVDAFLICKSQYLWAPLCKQVLAQAKESPEMQDRIFESANRILALKQKFLHQ
ncbi:MAG: beta-N-acetylhexosaminidase [Proteobacteria bacterium]|nr:beta-N-acetylhexosaminidase [Pseudomonadota bacterium]